MVLNANIKLRNPPHLNIILVNAITRDAFSRPVLGLNILDINVFLAWRIRHVHNIDDIRRSWEWLELVVWG